MPKIKCAIEIDTDNLNPNTYRKDIAEEFRLLHHALCERIAQELPEPSRIILPENGGKVVVP